MGLRERPGAIAALRSPVLRSWRLFWRGSLPPEHAPSMADATALGGAAAAVARSGKPRPLRSSANTLGKLS